MTVGWLSKKQTSTAMSTAEAEYRAMTEVLQRAVYSQKLAATFDKKQSSIILENDNIPASRMLKTLGATKQSKFI